MAAYPEKMMVKMDVRKRDGVRVVTRQAGKRQVNLATVESRKNHCPGQETKSERRSRVLGFPFQNPRKVLVGC